MVGWAPVYSWLPIRNMDALGYLHHMWSLNADLQAGFREERADHYRALAVRRVIAPDGGGAPPFAEPLAQFGRFRVFAVDGPGFVDLVDSPYWVNVPKRNVSRLHRAWLAGRMPAAGIHPAVRLLEEGDPVAGGYAADGVDVRLPEASIPPGPRGEVLSVERRGDDFTADVRADRACHLVLKMTFHPGWRARVDGEPAATVQLMPSFVGVELPPGRHRVELRWEPGPWKGRLLAAGLFVLAALFVAERRFAILRAATPGG